MDCRHCQTAFDPDLWESCPHCGADGEAERKLELSGVLRTSTILIAIGDECSAVYRSVEDVPEQLRRALVDSTNGQNSGTIYIADQRGREEIAKALRKLPGSEPNRAEAIAPVLGRFSCSVNPPQVAPERPRVSLSAVWFALMIIAFAGAVVWLLGGRAW